MKIRRPFAGLTPCVSTTYRLPTDSPTRIILAVSKPPVDAKISAFPEARVLTSFSIKVRLKLLFHENLPLRITVPLNPNSHPVFNIEPILVAIELPGTPLDGERGALRISPSIKFLK